MGHPNRTDPDERTYNRRWLIGVTAGPLVLGCAAAGWMYSVADRLPDMLASHWGSDGVDGYSPLWVTALIAVLAGGGSGALIAGLGILTRGCSLLLGRVTVGFGLAFGTLITALAVGAVAGQIDLADASQAAVSGPVTGIGSAVGAALGTAAALLYRPGEVDRTPTPETAAAGRAAADDRSAVVQAAQATAAQGGTLAVTVSMGRTAWLLSLGTGGLVALSVVFLHPLLALLCIPAAAVMWAFLHGRAIIDRDGVRVLAGGVKTLMPVGHGQIRSASVQDIRAMDHGGWGYRLNLGAVGFITGNGPALVLETGPALRHVISMPDPETAARACALVNAYRQAADLPKAAGAAAG